MAVILLVLVRWDSWAQRVVTGFWNLLCRFLKTKIKTKHRFIPKKETWCVFTQIISLIMR